MGSKNLKAVAVRGHRKLKMKESSGNSGLHDLGPAQYVMGQNEDGQLPS